MKKIIAGKKCDTDTAKCLGVWYNDTWSDKLTGITECLYLTRSGQYFIHGQGGPMTVYQKRISATETSGSEEIRLATEEEARAWAEEKLEADEVLEIFEYLEENKVIKSFRLTQSAIDLLESHKEKKGKSMSDLVDDAVKKVYG